ncbi:MAG TPA: class I SAM-dependent methyltransferase [Bacteroidia bacterium]|nr:class I SAM-dependent methyltransferase [Bacteroidia bacterium]
MRSIINSSNLEFHRNCLLCNSEKLHPLGGDYNRAWLVKCATCGLVFSGRIPVEEELQQHYRQYPRENYISPITILRYEELLRQQEPYRKLNRILDIGCGDGYFLETAKKNGWEVYGIEFTDDAVRVCREKGIPVHLGTILNFQPDVEFDVVTSFEVLEHINNGNAFLQKVKLLLRSGGIFYFTTPNFNSLSRRILGGKWNVIEYPEHLVYYTKATACNLVDMAGFQLDSIETTGFSIKRFRKSAGDSVAENADENLRRKIESKTYLQLAKKIVNRILKIFSCGDTLKAFCRKP